MKKAILIGLFFLVALSVFVLAQPINKDSIHISKGWNLIPFGALNKIDSGDTIKQSDIKYAYVYDLDDKEYILLIVNGEYTAEAKSKYSFNRGESHWLIFASVWTYADKEGDINQVNFEGVSKEYYNLKQGWNFKSVLPSMIGKTPNDIKGTCNIEGVYLWGTDGNPRWNSIIRDTKFPDSVLSGFVIKVSQDCALNTEGIATGTPPSLPINCQDSDGGKIVTINGTTMGMDWQNKQVIYEDKCEETTYKNYLREYYCLDNVVQNEGEFCPSGTTCKAGACVA